MRLMFVPPGEGLPLVEGKLMTEHGDEVEGVMTAVWDGDGKSKNAVCVSIVLMLEAIEDLEPERVDRAVNGLLAIRESTAQ